MFLFLNVVYAMNLRTVCGMFVRCSLCIRVCMLTVECLFMLCIAVRADGLLLKPCVEIC